MDTAKLVPNVDVERLREAMKEEYSQVARMES
jgi:hypothetical protein